jgi:hypothetical protein
MAAKANSKKKTNIENEPSSPYSVVNINNKFVVTKNGEQFEPPIEASGFKVTAFTAKEDAEKYKKILETLSAQKTRKSPSEF